jgi:hypothetical protein
VEEFAGVSQREVGECEEHGADDRGVGRIDERKKIVQKADRQQPRNWTLGCRLEEVGELKHSVDIAVHYADDEIRETRA